MIKNKSTLLGVTLTVFLGIFSFAFFANAMPEYKDLKEEWRKERTEYLQHKKEFKKDRMELKKQFRENKEHARDIRMEAINKVRAEKVKYKEKLMQAKSPEEREEILKEIREKRVDFRDKVVEKRKEFKATMVKKAKVRYEKRMEIAQKRFDYAIGRLTRISNRIKIVIDKLEEKGIGNLDEAKEYLAKAEKEINEAKVKFEESKNKYNLESISLDNEDALRDLFKEMRLDYKTIVSSLKQARQDLKHSVEIIKKVILDYKTKKELEPTPEQ